MRIVILLNKIVNRLILKEAKKIKFDGIKINMDENNILHFVKQNQK